MEAAFTICYFFLIKESSLEKEYLKVVVVVVESPQAPEDDPQKR